MIIDIFLKEYNINRKKFKTLANIDDEYINKINTYSVDRIPKDILNILSDISNLNIEKVIEKLKTIQNSNILYNADNITEVKYAIDSKASAFLINNNNMQSLLNEIREIQLSDDSKFMVDAGTMGGATFFSWLINLFVNRKKENYEKERESIKQHLVVYYKIHKVEDSTTKLIRK